MKSESSKLMMWYSQPLYKIDFCLVIKLQLSSHFYLGYFSWYYARKHIFSDYLWADEWDSIKLEKMENGRYDLFDLSSWIVWVDPKLIKQWTRWITSFSHSQIDHEYKRKEDPPWAKQNHILHLSKYLVEK